MRPFTGITSTFTDYCTQVRGVRHQLESCTVLLESGIFHFEKQEIYGYLRILFQNPCLASKFPVISAYYLGILAGIWNLCQKTMGSESCTEI